MKKLILILSSLLGLLWAEPSVLTDTAVPQETQAPQTSDATDQNAIDALFSNATENTSGVVLEHSNTPSHLYIGEIFPLTLKLTPTEIASGNIEYTLQGEEGIRIFSQTPVRSVKGDAVYDTFYFLVQADTIRLPDITATATSTGALSNVLTGLAINASTLNPPSTYANVLADSFKVIDYKTTAYNQESNIVVFTVKATRCNIATFSLVNAIKQGFESKLPNVAQSTMTYYAIIPNSEQTLDFTIFNLKKNRYESISIPIVVDDDAVSTQSDLSPTDARHTELKVGAAAIFAVICISLFYWRRSKWYLYASVLPLFYVIFALLPNSSVCVKKSAPVYLLPIKHGTIFETTPDEEKLEVENTVGEFTKVHLSNNKVGWVHERDLCSN
ncbi:MAG: hypothetical protein Q7T77_11185 [Sulfuricurvum sp.]|nr:hypothetical protein [Sulfuricurvum sp.]